jgi:hypothetical protein
MADIEGVADLIPKAFNTADTQTNLSGSGNPVIVVNQDKKKKPYDVKFGKNEPKVKPNMKYSAKQSYRHYKTKIEPKVNSKIMVDEEDDIVKQIKKSFGINPENTNYSSVESAPIAPNSFDFASPVENPPIQSASGHMNDDDFLMLFNYGYGLDDDIAKGRFNDYFNEIIAQDPSIMGDMKKRVVILQDYLRDNGLVFYKAEQIPRLKLVAHLTVEKAKRIFDKLPDTDKTTINDYLDEELDNHRISSRDKELTNTIKRELLYKIELEDEFDDIYKADEEALLGMKVPDEKNSTGLNLTLYDSDDDESGSGSDEDASPVHAGSSTLSAKTTAPYGTETASSVGEITSVEDAKRRPKPKRSVGRPAKKPERIAGQIIDDLVNSAVLDATVRASRKK